MAFKMITLPKQISDADEFKKISESASICKVVKRDGKVKLKLRTPKILYTYITDETEAEELLKGIKIDTIDF